LDIEVKIDSIKQGIKKMNEGGDISKLAMTFLNADLDQLQLQVKNVNLEYKEILK